MTECARISYFFTKSKYKEENIWLICETPLQCQENGYYLFKWIRENYPELPVYYIISQNAPGLNQVKQLGNVIYHKTFYEYFYMFHAKRIISTHGLWILPDEFGILKKITKKQLKAKKIMLNHGVGFLKNGKAFYHKSIFALNDLIMALSQKHKEIFLNEYGYEDKDVVITGYPRFDDLIDKSEESEFSNLIVFMPTFRDKEDNIGEAFRNTELFLTLKRIMQDQKLLDFLLKNNVVFGIYLHQNIQQYSYMLEEYSSSNMRVLIQGKFTVQKLLKESRILITDYSSVFFDFVYMKKPFISYQFDYDKFIASRKDKAFIDFENDLPGYVVERHEDLIEKIMEIVNTNYIFPLEHEQKSKMFFQYDDRNNCKRVFNAIKGSIT